MKDIIDAFTSRAGTRQIHYWLLHCADYQRLYLVTSRKQREPTPLIEAGNSTGLVPKEEK